MKLSIDKVVSAVGGEIIRETATPIIVNGVSIDSREDQTGKLFVALKGEHFDGHVFVQAAFAAGAFSVRSSESSIESAEAPRRRNEAVPDGSAGGWIRSDLARAR